ncbi:MAG: hypothetical protein C0467_21115 [Planctomycetaceae bacterium]|nr:hypothetical protein [Planctomycetaceae bacterium]
MPDRVESERSGFNAGSKSWPQLAPTTYRGAKDTHRDVWVKMKFNNTCELTSQRIGGKINHSPTPKFLDHNTLHSQTIRSIWL